MLTTLLGSCRLNSFIHLLECTSIHDGVSYVHSTKEILQLINIIKGQVVLPIDMMRYALRAGILQKEPVEINQKVIDEFNSTELFIIEICSIKKYLYNGIYLHHLAVDSKWGRNFWKDTPSYVVSSTIIEEQTREEIEEDIKEILHILVNKKIIFVTHILPDKGLVKRKYLIDLLEDLRKRDGLILISPTECLTKDLVTSDFGHYNPEAEIGVLLPYYRKKLIEIGILNENVI